MTDIDRGTSPIPGESRLFLVTMVVFTAMSGVWLLIVLMFMLFGGLAPDALIAPVLLGAASAIGWFWARVQRREYLRKVRNGDIIVRERWSGADLLPPG